MSKKNRPACRVAILVLGAAVALACGVSAAQDVRPPSSATIGQTQPTPFKPLTIKHAMGSTVLKDRPERVVPYDMNDLDFLDHLGVPIVGMPKDYVPHFLTKYKNDRNIKPVGSSLQPNLEQLHALKPDLILVYPVQARHYKDLAEIAPTLYYDVDFMNDRRDYIGDVKKQLLTLGQIFGVETRAREKIAELDAAIEKTKQITQGRAEKALVVMHNNGSYTAFGVQSRYGFIHDAFGVKPASLHIEPGLHGQAISNEFIHEADPDILYVVDRTAAVEHRPPVNAKTLENPLLRETKAWKNGRVIFVDSDAWYTTAASLTSLKILLDDVAKGYAR